jgi:hypothetical protein
VLIIFKEIKMEMIGMVLGVMVLAFVVYKMFFSK